MEKFFKKHIIVIILLSFIAIGAIAGGVYYFIQYQKTQQLLKDPTLAGQLEVASLIDKVGRLIELPKNEQPTIATVSDYTKLQDQQFFQNAKNGDKVLIYSKAKKAILYDPQQDKVIEVAPVNLGQNQTQISEGASPSAAITPAPLPMKIALYNGTRTTGLTNIYEKLLKSKLPGIEVIDKTNAKKNDYTDTIIVALNSNQASNATQIATIVNGKVTTSIPQGETKPVNADILVILGK